MTSRPRAATLLATLFLLATSPTHAANLYCSDSAGIHRIDAATGGNHQLIPRDATGLAVHGGMLYSTFLGAVTVSALDGSNPQPAANLPQHLRDQLDNVARDAHGNVYSPSNDQAHILRTPPAGLPITILTTGHRFSPPPTILVEHATDKLYWMGGWNELASGLLERANLDGSNVETLIGPDLLLLGDYTARFALDLPGNRVYWANLELGFLYAAPLGVVSDGDDIQTLYDLTDAPTAIAVEPTPEPAALALFAPATALCGRPRRKALNT